MAEQTLVEMINLCKAQVSLKDRTGVFWPLHFSALENFNLERAEQAQVLSFSLL